SFGLLFATAIFWLCRDASRKVNRVFRGLQVVSASGMSLSHGLNDAQNTMGIVAAALLVYGRLPASAFTIPLWVKLAAATAVGLGTGYGGWRIMKTMGMKVAKLDPVHGFTAETGAGLVIASFAHFGYPLSTTHVISTSVMGVGATKRLSAVRW